MSVHDAPPDLQQQLNRMGYPNYVFVGWKRYDAGPGWRASVYYPLQFDGKPLRATMVITDREREKNSRDGLLALLVVQLEMAVASLRDIAVEIFA